MKYLALILSLCFTFVMANEIEVSAKEFIGDEQKRLTQLKGNVEIKRAKDRLTANEAFIFLDSNNRPNKMLAIGNVRFWITLKDGREFEGESKEALYFPNQREYQILGDAIVREPAKNNIVRGNKIIVRYQDGYINVVGDDNKPARLIFKLDKEQ